MSAKANRRGSSLMLHQQGYTLGETIGVGGYSKVKSGRRLRTGAKIAVKIIDKRKAPQGYLAKFLPREIEALRTVHHEHVIQLFDVIETPEKVMLIMEHAATGDLLDYINYNGSLDEEEARKLFVQMAAAVQFSHDKGVIHRDLKCENMLLDSQQNIKVSDFGFAITVSDSSARLGTHCGSYAYAAPEILLGERYDGKASDVWSLGVILYAMTCGRLPYNDKSMKVLMQGIRRKLTMPRSMSGELRDLVQLLLTIDCKTRITLARALKHPWCKREAASVAQPAESASSPAETRPNSARARSARGASSRPTSGFGTHTPSQPSSPLSHSSTTAKSGQASPLRITSGDLSASGSRGDSGKSPNRGQRPNAAVSNKGRERGSTVAARYEQQHQARQKQQSKKADSHPPFVHNRIADYSTPVKVSAFRKEDPGQAGQNGQQSGHHRDPATKAVSLPPVTTASSPGQAVMQSLASTCRAEAQTRRQRPWSWKPLTNMAFWRSN